MEQSKILKELGINEKNQYLLHDENAKKFFEYIVENLDDDNVLTDKELQFYEDLVASGQFLEGDTLAEKMKEVEFMYPGIFSITDTDVEEMEQELKFLEADNTEREERIARMDETLKQQAVDIRKAEERQFELEYESKLVSENCVRKAQELMELQNSNKEKVEQLIEVYTQPQNPPAFIHQMPLDQHFHKCDQFLSQVDDIMRKNFNVSCTTDETSNDTDAISALMDIQKRVVESEKKNFEESLTMAGYTYVIENIDRFKSRASSDYHEMRAVIDDMEAEVENLTLQFEVVQKEAEMLIEESVELDVLELLNDHMEKKNKQSMKRVDTIQTVLEAADNVSLLYELMWIVQQLDLERIVKAREIDCERLNIQAQDSARRIRCMKNHARRDPEGARNEILMKKLQDLITEHLPVHKNQLPTVDACVEELLKFQEHIRMIINSCLSQENLMNVYSVINQIDDQSIVLQEFIFNGPTNRPKLYDTKFTVEIYDRKQQTKEMEEAYNILKANYKKNINLPSQNDKYFRMEKNLWIYFLTEPKKVLECIEQVKKKAAEKGTSSFKALNINISKAK